MRLGVIVAPAQPALDVAAVHPLLAVVLGLGLCAGVASVIWLGLFVSGAVD